MSEKGIKKTELNNAAYEATIKLEKARTALRTTIDNFELNRTDMDETDSRFLVYNLQSICNMLEIIDDYISNANNELVEALR